MNFTVSRDVVEEIVEETVKILKKHKPNINAFELNRYALVVAANILYHSTDSVNELLVKHNDEVNKLTLKQIDFIEEYKPIPMVYIASALNSALVMLDSIERASLDIKELEVSEEPKEFEESKEPVCDCEQDCGDDCKCKKE